MLIATADDPKRVRRETRQVLHRLIDGMLSYFDLKNTRLC
jgi:hypothetical protein